MATLTLTKVFLNRLDTGEALAAQSGPDRPQQWATRGEVRQFAGGRQRAVRAVGEAGTFAPTLVDLTLAQVVKLRSWVGVPLLVRDHRGQCFTAVFFTVPVKESKTPTLYDVGLGFQVVTVTDSTAV